jgi:hypothetical protein
MFDIYGGRLLRGHCEVHPHVHEEYPCSVCLTESRQKQREHDEQRIADAAYEAEYYQAMYEDHCRQLGFDPVALGM